MPDAIFIETGWPEAILSPNARPGHPIQLHKAKKRAKGEAYLSTLHAAGIAKVKPRDFGAMGKRFRITIHAYPSVTRNRDEDNLVSSVKAHLDGIARALDVDDSRFNAPLVAFHDRRAGGARLFFEIAPC